MHMLVKLDFAKAQDLINLVKTQGNIDFQNRNGETALHLCVNTKRG